MKTFSEFILEAVKAKKRSADAVYKVTKKKKITPTFLQGL